MGTSFSLLRAARPDPLLKDGLAAPHFGVIAGHTQSKTIGGSKK